MLLSIFASTPASADWVITTADVSTAFLYGKTQREVYIELPAEDRRRDGGKNVAMIVRSVYGGRDAHQVWQRTKTSAIESCGLKGSPHQPGVYGAGGLHVVAHVDDILATGARAKVVGCVSVLQQTFTMKYTVLGRGSKDLKSIEYLRHVP